MGMRIGGSGAVGGPADAIAGWQQRQQSFQQLTSALQSGDLSGAQQAFASLTGKASTQGTGQGTGPLAQLGQALSSGDLAGAQQALQTLQSNRAQHHHHHQGGSGASTSGASPASPSATGSLINATA